MQRLKIELPSAFPFSCEIPIRITDLNYGEHVGNDTVLSLIHEARMQYLRSLGYTEMKFGGAGMIMADVSIQFRNELFYGDLVIASVAPGEISKVGFDLYYRLEKIVDGKKLEVANAKTGMVCYDYDKKKIVPVPDEAKQKLLLPIAY